METLLQPLSLFTNWYNEESKASKVRIPSAVCFSTNGTDGFPNARTISFKELVDGAFVVTGPMSSRKGEEISGSNKVALTFWWTETERQVRIQGLANPIAETLADRYFASRSQISKAVSAISAQGKVLEDPYALEQQVQAMAKEVNIERPANWGGFSIQPIRMEFMDFKASRLHERLLYTLENGTWKIQQIQP